MNGNRVWRHGRWIILLLPVAAIAQVLPPPPPPLAPPPQPPGNPVTAAKASLGKALFWDEQLSSTRTVACGSCHQAFVGGSDPRTVPGAARATHPGLDGVAGTADDVTGSPGVVLNQSGGAMAWSSAFGLREQVTGRKANSHIDAGYSPELFWDGRAGGAFRDPLTGDTILAVGAALESQAAGPPLSDVEMGHLGRDWANAASRIEASRPLALAAFVPAALSDWIGARSYPELFQEAFGTPAVTPARIAMAIASYERTLFSNQTPFDSANAGLAALTPQENAGRQLFTTLPCARCHGGPLLSDNQYHYIGVRPAGEDAGRMAVTGRPQDLGAFRTPSLRNASLRRSFMHNGRFSTLEEVVDFYDRGGDFDAPNKSPLITPLNLTPPQKNQLLAFLRRPLTDPRVANSQAPFDRPALFSETPFVPRVLDGGVPGAAGIPQVVALEPPLAGNPSFTVGVHGAPALANAVLAIDASEPPAAGGPPATASFARLSTTLIGATGTAGFGSVTLAIPDDPALHGRTLYGRWYVDDPTAPDGVASSPAFRMTVFGPRGAGLTMAVDATPTSAQRILRLHASRPNPFQSSTTIRYELFAAAMVTLRVYDLAGRVVRTLVPSTYQAPGPYATTWDGRDDDGRLLAGGVYFSRLESAGASQAYRVVRLD
jgi:cytochrome c peroxidase